MVVRKRKPCPGCGGISTSRPADQVCYECKSLIAEAKERRAFLARAKDIEPVKLPFAPHCLPHVYHFSNPFQPSQGSPRALIQNFMFEIVKLVGEKTTWRTAVIPSPTLQRHGYLIEGQMGCSGSSQDTYWLVPRGLQALLNKLYQAILAGAAIAYEEGHQRGHNMIVGLASGSTSIDDFNEATIGKKKGTRR